MSLSDSEADDFGEFQSDHDDARNGDPDDEPELSFYESLARGKQLVLDEALGIDVVKGIAMAANLSGTFLATGSRDGTLRVINFDKWAKNGFGDYWKTRLEQSVNSIAFNTEESVLAVASGNHLHFYTDGGDLIIKTTKGDMYLLDAKKTKGHTATVNSVANDPKNSNRFASASMDGTARVFDITANKHCISVSISNAHIYTLSNKYLGRNRANGAAAGKLSRAGFNCICYANSNFKDVIAAGNELGDLAVWDHKTAFQSILVRAHEDSVDAVLSYDDNKLVSRAGASVKFWDLKKTQAPLKEITLPKWAAGLRESQSIVLSPDNLHLLVNVSNRGGGTPKEPGLAADTQSHKSQLWAVDLEKLEVVNELRADAELGPLVWAYETNQLFSLCTDGKILARCADEKAGANHSTKARQALEKKNKYAKVNTVSATPEAFPFDQIHEEFVEVDEGTYKPKKMTREDRYGIPRLDRFDFLRRGRTPVAYEHDDIVKKLRSQASDDPNREFTEEGVSQIPYKADKFMAMYKKTQPNLILDFNKPESKHEKMLLGVSKCPRCGIKICQCGYMDGNK